jgi:predicted DNA-binding transcriptional regulator YafY
MSNLISESRQLKDRILLEYIPSGREHLSTIIEAIRNKIEISIVHQSYRADSPKEYTVQPYCIKLFNQRWYILGMCKEVDSIRTFGLDRIHSIRHLKTTFEFPTDFDAVKYYNECFGIVSDDGTKVETIKLKVYGLQRYYLRSLPLHSSQQEIDSADDYSIFQYQVRPTFDFRQALLSKGSEVEVLEPITFREEMKNEIQNMKNRYL